MVSNTLTLTVDPAQTQMGAELATTFREVSEVILRDVHDHMTRGDTPAVREALEKFKAFAVKWPAHPQFCSFLEFCDAMADRAKTRTVSNEDYSSLQCHVQACIGVLREMGLLEGTTSLPASTVAAISLVPEQEVVNDKLDPGQSFPSDTDTIPRK